MIIDMVLVRIDYEMYMLLDHIVEAQLSSVLGHYQTVVQTMHL